MGRSNALTLAALVLLAGSAAAGAADMLPPPMMPPPARLASVSPVPEYSGWYLRGDIGMGAEPLATWSMTPDRMLGNGTSYVPTSYSKSEAHVSSPVFMGIGVGYQFNNWFHADATVEYRGASRFSSNALLTFQDRTATPVNTTTLRTFNRGDLSSVVGLLNGYVDLGTWSDVTPFVGFGVGIARNKISGLVDQGFYTDTAGGSGATGGFYGEGSKTNLAWALMAGVGYTLSPNARVEFGYRYMDTGKASSGDLVCYSGGSCGSNVQLKTAKNVAQDIKIGGRWMFTRDYTPVRVEPALIAAPPPRLAYEPQQPLIRKY